MRRKNKSIYIVLVVVALIGITIGYAVINTTLNINGKSSISKNTWDVYFDNVVTTNGSVEAVKIPTIENSTTVDFEVALNLPGDFYEFTVDVVNDGTIDAMIESITKEPELTEAQQKYLNYIIEYQNGDQIQSKQLVAKESFVRLKVRVEFRKDITASDLPTTSETLNLAFTVNYVQNDGSGNIVSNNGVQLVKVVSGDGTQVGNEVCIGEECFYVISSDSYTVTMLAKYNLHVGNSVDEDWNVTPLASPTGKQDIAAIGLNLDYDGTEIHPWIGTITFSETSNDYSGSIVEGYVNSYNNYLITQGITPIEARLITYYELIGLGCSQLDGSCSEAPEWVYATSYWSSGAPDISSYVSCVHSNGDFYSDHDYSDNDRNGCRPVITISRSLI